MQERRRPFSESMVAYLEGLAWVESGHRRDSLVLNEREHSRICHTYRSVVNIPASRW
jgi:hypothetical protein